MTKKQRNKKLVAQNQRNRIINRHYSSTIKTLFKLFLNKLKVFNTKNLENQKVKVGIELKILVNNLYQIIDKAQKKEVIHKNTAARKKSKIGKLFSCLQY
jgi:small subunit ribosomal protein S20